MRKLILIIALLLVPSFLYASGLGVSYVGSGVGYCDLYIQDFNATTEPSPPTNWTEENAAVNWDSSAAPTDMEGAQEVELGAGGTGWHASYAFTDTDTIYATFHWQIDDDPENDEDIIRLYGNSNLIGTAKIDLPGPGIVLQATGGSWSSETTTQIAQDTIYKFKIKYVHTGASNNSFNLWIWDGESWGDNISSTNGTSDYDIDQIRFINGCDTEKVYFDYFKLSSQDITSPD